MMAERWMAKIMGKPCKFDNILVDKIVLELRHRGVQALRNRLCYLRDLKRVSKSVSKEIRLKSWEELRLAL